MKDLKRSVLLLALVVLCASVGVAQQSAAGAAQQPALRLTPLVKEGKVINVHDGDTVTLLENSKKTTIRLQGIDAPELKQEYGSASQQNLSRMVLGKQVTVVWTKLDKYRRTVGTIMLDGHDVNIEQVKAGLAWHFKKYEDEQEPADRATYAAAEVQARAAKLGLWKDDDPTPPGDWRADIKTKRWGPAPPEGTVIGNSNSKKYHRPDCPGYRDMAERNRVFFKSVAEAESAGYKRAGNCPPEDQAVVMKATPSAPVPVLPVSATVTPSTTTVPATPQKRIDSDPKPFTREGVPPQPPVADQAVVSNSAEQIIGNKNSKKYHRPGCPGYKTVSEKNQIFFKNTAEAEAAGYERAGNCPADTNASGPLTPVSSTAIATSMTETPAAKQEIDSDPKPVTIAPREPATETTEQIIGNKNSKKYHRPGCPGYRTISEKNQIFFKSSAEAEAAGYERAGNCPAADTSTPATPVSSAATAISTTETPAAQPAATEATEAGTSTGQIIGNKNSKIYHVPGCSTYNSVSEKNRVYFSTAEEAEKAGYRKSKACH